MSKILFTADNHFFHRNATLEFGGFRPFQTVDEMNNILINRWNEVVDNTDLVYVIGDFSFGKGDETCDLIDRLNGDIFYIKGNHESHLKKFGHKFVEIKDRHDVGIQYNRAGSENGKMRIILHHFACRVWDKSHRGTWHLYGHTHNDLYDNPYSMSFDIGVDCHNFYPLTVEQVIEKMEKKKGFGAPFEQVKIWERTGVL